MPVCLARGRPPSPPVLGPLRWGLAPPRGGNRPPPFLPPARRASPRGGRVSSRPSPAPAKVKLSRWRRSFLALSARSQLPQPGQFEVSTEERSDSESPPPGARAASVSWRAERTLAERQGRTLRAHSAHAPPRAAGGKNATPSCQSLPPAALAAWHRAG